MNIIVFIKQTPDTNFEVKLNDAKTNIKLIDNELVLNPNDEFAVKEAVDLRNKFGGEVVVVSLGPNFVQKALRTCLAKGADRAIHLLTDSIGGFDSLETAFILADAATGIFKEKNETFDLIFCGSKAVDTDNGIIGIQIACFLGIAHIAPIVKLETDVKLKKIVAQRYASDSLEVVECSFPALLSCQKGLNSPSNVIPLPKILQAKKKRLDIISASTGLKTNELLSIEFAPLRESGRILSGLFDDKVRELAAILKEKMKEI